MLILMTTKKRILIYFIFFMTGILSATAIKAINRRSLAVMETQSTCAYVAIIIDDFGNSSQATEQMLSLPIKFTGAVMPFMPKSRQEAELLHSCGKSVILHQPMEAHSGKPSWLGPSPILNSFSRQQAREILNKGLAEVPYCAGINNHMGSRVTENSVLMDEILTQLKKNNLIYIDSVTTSKSVACEIAEKTGTDLIKRDVFLDSTDNIEAVKKNIFKTGDIALKKGYAVAIGHVGAEGGNVTYQALNSTYKELEKKGIKFVGIEELNEIIKKSA